MSTGVLSRDVAVAVDAARAASKSPHRTVRGGGGALISLDTGYTARAAAANQPNHHHQHHTTNNTTTTTQNTLPRDSRPASPPAVPLKAIHFGELPASIPAIRAHRAAAAAAIADNAKENSTGMMRARGRSKTRAGSIDFNAARIPSSSPHRATTPPTSSSSPNPKSSPIRRPLAASFGRPPMSKSLTASSLGLESLEPTDPSFHMRVDGVGHSRPDSSPYAASHLSASSPASHGPSRLRGMGQAAHQPNMAQAHAFLASLDPKKFLLSFWLSHASKQPATSAASTGGNIGVTTELTTTRVMLVGKTIREFDSSIDAIPVRYRQIQDLLLGNNYLEHVRGIRNLFPKLKSLSLANNCIHDMSGLEELAGMTELVNLYLEGNPVCHMPTYRSHILTLLPALQILDGKKVTDEDRQRAREMIAKETSYLDMMLRNAVYLLQLKEVSLHLRLNLEFLHFAYGRVGVFNRQHPPLYDGNLGNIDVPALINLVHANDYTDARMRQLMLSRCLKKVHHKWLKNFRHLLSLDASPQMLQESWDASFSSLLAGQQTHASNLVREVDDLRRTLHDRHTALMDSAERTDRRLEIRPQQHFDTETNNTNAKPPLSKEARAAIAARKSTALREAAASVPVPPHARSRSPSASPSPTRRKDWSDLDSEFSSAFHGPHVTLDPLAWSRGGVVGTSAGSTSRVGGGTPHRARSQSVDRARRAKALAGLKSKAVHKGVGVVTSNSTRMPNRASGGATKAIPYSSMVAKVSASVGGGAAIGMQKPWEGSASGRSRRVSRRDSRTHDDIGAEFDLAASMRSHQHDDRYNHNGPHPDSSLSHAADEHNHTFFSVHNAQDTPLTAGRQSNTPAAPTQQQANSPGAPHAYYNGPSHTVTLASPPSPSAAFPPNSPVGGGSTATHGDVYHLTPIVDDRSMGVPHTPLQPLHDSAHPHAYPTPAQYTALHQQSNQVLSPALNSPQQNIAPPQPFLDRTGAMPPHAPAVSSSSSLVDRVSCVLPDLPGLLSERTAQVESLALLNEKLREKLEEFRVQNLQNVNVADSELSKLAAELAHTRQLNADLEKRVTVLTEEKGLLLKGHGPSVVEAHQTIAQLENEKSILTRSLHERETALREAQDSHAGEMLIQRTENMKIRDELAKAQAAEIAAVQAAQSKEVEILQLQQTLLKVSHEYDRMAGNDSNTADQYNLPTSSHLADALERAKLLAERQEELRRAEKARASEVAQAEALHQEMRKESAAASSSNLTQVVSALQESRQLLRLYRREHERLDAQNALAEVDTYLLEHEPVALRFMRLTAKRASRIMQQCMRTWFRFRACEKAGRALRAQRQRTRLAQVIRLWQVALSRRLAAQQFRTKQLLATTMREWKKSFADKKADGVKLSLAAAFASRLLLRSHLRNWRVAVSICRRDRDESAHQAAQLAAQEKSRERMAELIQIWHSNARYTVGMRRIKKMTRTHALKKTFQRWMDAQQRVQRAAENGALLSEIATRRRLADSWFAWKCMLAFVGEIRSLTGRFDSRRRAHLWHRWQEARKVQQATEAIINRARVFHAGVARKRTIQVWKVNTLDVKRRRDRAIRARTLKPLLPLNKLKRHMLAWRAATKAHRSKQMQLLSLRAHMSLATLRRNFHVWFLTMQRVRLSRLADSNTLLQHDLNLAHTKMKLLASENHAMTTSLQERVYAEVDIKEQEAEYEKKEIAYQINLKNELALREKLKQYEQREYDLSQSVHDTKHLLSSKISESRSLTSQLHHEQELRKRFMRDLESASISHSALIENLDLILAQTAQVMVASEFQTIENSKQWVVSVTNRLRGMLQSHHSASKSESEQTEVALKAAEQVAQIATLDSPLKRQVDRADRSLASSPTKAMFAPINGESYIPRHRSLSPPSRSISPTATPHAFATTNNASFIRRPASPPFEPRFASSTNTSVASLIQPVESGPSGLSHSVAAAGRAHFLGATPSSIHMGPASTIITDRIATAHNQTHTTQTPMAVKPHPNTIGVNHPTATATATRPPPTHPHTHTTPYPHSHSHSHSHSHPSHHPNQTMTATPMQRGGQVHFLSATTAPINTVTFAQPTNPMHMHMQPTSDTHTHTHTPIPMPHPHPHPHPPAVSSVVGPIPPRTPAAVAVSTALSVDRVGMGGYEADLDREWREAEAKVASSKHNHNHNHNNNNNRTSTK